MSESNKQQNIIKALLKISSLVVESKDLTFLYHEIHRIISEILFAENVAIVKYNNENKTILFDYVEDERDSAQMKGKTYPLGQGLSSYVFSQRGPVLLSEQEILEMIDDGTITLIGTLPKSWMGVPIQNADTFFGLVIVQSYVDECIYTKADLDLLAFVASHLSIVFETKNIIESEKSALKLVNKNYDLINQQKQALESTLSDLKEAQFELIEKEKMASLGGLVAGMAHEVNTPIGICVTGASHLQAESSLFKEKIEAGTANDQDLYDFLDDVNESCLILLNNARRAADLVGSFKMIAVDQSSNKIRDIVVAKYLDEVMLSLRPMLKKLPHEITINCNENINLRTIPGALSQVLTNLITNSISHAFEGRESGRIHIDVTESDGVTINYNDDGIGMDPKALSKLFEPFYTTKRGFGGSGLGAHLIYNLVTQSLAGKLSVSSQPGEGLFFKITLPNL